MASIVRMARHHPDYLLTEFKPLVQHVMTHVKNLRSQVKFFHESHPIKLWKGKCFETFSIQVIKLNRFLNLGMPSRSHGHGRTFSSSKEEYGIRFGENSDRVSSEIG